jgi:hypothetical protein
VVTSAEVGSSLQAVVTATNTSGVAVAMTQLSAAAH